MEVLLPSEICWTPHYFSDLNSGKVGRDHPLEMKWLERGIVRYHLGSEKGLQSLEFCCFSPSDVGSRAGITKLVDSGIGGNPLAEVLLVLAERLGGVKQLCLLKPCWDTDQVHQRDSGEGSDFDSPGKSPIPCLCGSARNSFLRKLFWFQTKEILKREV